MSFLEARRRAAQLERRRSARFTIDIPVTLRTISGNRECRMANISDNGAKLETSAPPHEGVSGWLIMGTDEIYCTVVWSNDGACGIEFERALGEDRLVEIAGEQVKETVPIANTGKIQMGRKRGSLLGGGEASEPEPQIELQDVPEPRTEPKPQPQPQPQPQPRTEKSAFMSKRQAISAS